MKANGIIRATIAFLLLLSPMVRAQKVTIKTGIEVLKAENFKSLEARGTNNKSYRCGQQS